jgi:hypothetical protein
MKQILESAQTFILSNARLLERHLFAYLFQGGDRQQVLTALLAYQNKDGGFGNALEPDKRTPTSQPIDQEFALRVLDDIGFDRSIAIQICDFLETISSNGGVPFVLPTVRDAPRAEWWNTETDDPPPTINPTASIAGLLHKHQIQHPWLEHATDFCWGQVEHFQELSGHDLLCIRCSSNIFQIETGQSESSSESASICWKVGRLLMTHRPVDMSSCLWSTPPRRTRCAVVFSTTRRSRLIWRRWPANNRKTVAGRSPGTRSAQPARWKTVGSSQFVCFRR